MTTTLELSDREKAIARGEDPDIAVVAAAESEGGEKATDAVASDESRESGKDASSGGAGDEGGKDAASGSSGGGEAEGKVDESWIQDEHRQLAQSYGLTD